MSLVSRDTMYLGIGVVYIGGSTWDVLGILGYYVLRDWGGLYGGKYLGCPWYPGILCIEGLYGGCTCMWCPWYPGIVCIEGLGVYMEECTWDVLGIPRYYVLRDWGVYMGGCTWDVLGIPRYHVLRDWGVYMGGRTLDVLGIPGYYVLRDWGSYGGMYLGCPWYPGILWLYWGLWKDVPGMSLVSWDTTYRG